MYDFSPDLPWLSREVNKTRTDFHSSFLTSQNKTLPDLKSSAVRNFQTTRPIRRSQHYFGHRNTLE